ncbi:hypothetical protein DSCO28_37860 [Desulfosarcina ovata subsp. sediminis]|uniref:Uncharacterized protein n=1 Tax=Desulfosarcina ovata subsp. sediminis TaxID=885957 RepID=A0A5K7ZSN6_9BACT|nr:hypothetical protein DSCO28_37860 [Desulfosarcina ovata subsp. sediminis]
MSIISVGDPYTGFWNINFQAGTKWLSHKNEPHRNLDNLPKAKLRTIGDRQQGVVYTEKYIFWLSIKLK